LQVCKGERGEAPMLRGRWTRRAREDTAAATRPAAIAQGEGGDCRGGGGRGKGWYGNVQRKEM
jgi:hypothetical protein